MCDYPGNLQTWPSKRRPNSVKSNNSDTPQQESGGQTSLKKLMKNRNLKDDHLEVEKDEKNIVQCKNQRLISIFETIKMTKMPKNRENNAINNCRENIYQLN